MRTTTNHLVTFVMLTLFLLVAYGVEISAQESPEVGQAVEELATQGTAVTRADGSGNEQRGFALDFLDLDGTGWHRPARFGWAAALSVAQGAPAG